MLVLSLFPGLGLLDMAFEEEGFCIVRGPDILWGGDIRRFHPPTGRFDGVIGGPPCQRFSQLVHVVRARGYCEAEDLIPEFKRCVAEAQPGWFLMENVKHAPIPKVQRYGVHSFLLNNRCFGAEQSRVRRFSFGVRSASPVNLLRFLEVQLFEAPASVPTVLASGSFSPSAHRRLSKKYGPSWATVEDGLEAQGLPRDYLKDTPLTARGAQKMVGNGVPLPMGRAIARAVKRAIEEVKPCPLIE